MRKLACFAVWVLYAGRLLGAPDATALLKQAETLRTPQEPYQSEIRLTDDKQGKKEERTYQGLSKGRAKALVRFLTPEADRGTKLLLVENDMWVFVPSTAKPIRISPRQKLLGNAAYGDIVRLNFVDNYQAKFLRVDTFKGRRVDVLDLTAIDGRPVTYDRVEYWIDSSTHGPIKALYQTSSGKTLREGYFENLENVLGVKRPTRVILVDFVEKDHVTTLNFSKTVKGNFSDLLFEKENFARD